MYYSPNSMVIPKMGEMREMGEMRTVMVKTYHGVSVCRGGFRD